MTLHVGNLALAHSSFSSAQVLDSDICNRLPDDTISHYDANPKNERCVTHHVDERGFHHFVPTGIPDNRCVDAILTQRICRYNATATIVGSMPLRTSCIDGFEIDCERYVSPTVADALMVWQAVYPAIQSACTAVTVGNVGYSDKALQQLQISRPNLQAPQNRSGAVVNCDFLNQSISVDNGFCQVLTECVEPRLNESYTIVGYEGRAPKYLFPSGIRELHIDLSCSQETNSHSLHNYQHGCRAIDINVNDNFGNLRRNSINLPTTNMPPEFVSIMEDCGVIWGGRYRGANGIWEGCDPMEFAYAPACEIHGYSYEVTQQPRTRVDTVTEMTVVDFMFADAVTMDAQMFYGLIDKDHPFWAAPDLEWWFHVRIFDGTGTWNHTLHYAVDATDIPAAQPDLLPTYVPPIFQWK